MSATTIRRALVVDDDEGVLRSYLRLLDGAGFEVDAACDGEEALAALRRDAYDLVVSDVDMPRLDGLALLDGLRREGMSTPVILVTGEPSPDVAIGAMKRGAFHVLAKPVDPALLLEVAAAAIAASPARE